jgi:hypothetical protein
MRRVGRPGPETKTFRAMPMFAAADTIAPVAVKSQVIAARRDFDRLLLGYDRLKAVSYVVSSELLLVLFNEYGFEQADVVVGDSMTGTSLIEQYRLSLRGRGVQTTRKVGELVADGKLRIYVPRRTLHSKLYILSRPSGFRIIQGSAKLTETACQASRQVNYVWYANLDDASPWLERLLGDYEAHRKDCELFMGGLAELVREADEPDRDAVVEAWLSGSVGAGTNDGDAREILQHLTAHSLQRVRDNADPVFTVSLPDAPTSKRQVERAVGPLGFPQRDQRSSTLTPTFATWIGRCRYH